MKAHLVTTTADQSPHPDDPSEILQQHINPSARYELWDDGWTGRSTEEALCTRQSKQTTVVTAAVVVKSNLVHRNINCFEGESV